MRSKPKRNVPATEILALQENECIRRKNKELAIENNSYKMMIAGLKNENLELQSQFLRQNEKIVMLTKTINEMMSVSQNLLYKNANEIIQNLLKVCNAAFSNKSPETSNVSECDSEIIARTPEEPPTNSTPRSLPKSASPSKTPKITIRRKQRDLVADSFLTENETPEQVLVGEKDLDANNQTSGASFRAEQRDDEEDNYGLSTICEEETPNTTKRQTRNSSISRLDLSTSLEAESDLSSENRERTLVNSKSNRALQSNSSKRKSTSLKADLLESDLVSGNRERTLVNSKPNKSLQIDSSEREIEITPLSCEEGTHSPLKNVMSAPLGSSTPTSHKRNRRSSRSLFKSSSEASISLNGDSQRQFISLESSHDDISKNISSSKERKPKIESNRADVLQQSLQEKNMNSPSLLGNTNDFKTDEDTIRRCRIFNSFQPDISEMNNLTDRKLRVRSFRPNYNDQEDFKFFSEISHNTGGSTDSLSGRLDGSIESRSAKKRRIATYKSTRKISDESPSNERTEEEIKENRSSDMVTKRKPLINKVSQSSTDLTVDTNNSIRKSSRWLTPKSSTKKERGIERLTPKNCAKKKRGIERKDQTAMKDCGTTSSTSGTIKSSGKTDEKVPTTESKDVFKSSFAILRSPRPTRAAHKLVLKEPSLRKKLRRS